MCFFRRRRWPARLAILVAASAAIVLLGIASFSYGSKLYRDWHERRLLHRATSLLQEEKFDQAAQNAHKVLAVDPNSLPARYILAEAAERQNLEDAVLWRAQIARLLSKDPDSQLNLASAALRFGQIDLARKALNEVVPHYRGSAAFHVVAGWLARAEGNLAEQEAQFAAALKEEPGNDLYQFNLAALQIQSNDSEKSAKARAVLDRLTKVAPFRTGALRALLNDAVGRNDLAAADNFAQQLQMSQEVTFGDYLLCLTFYRKLDEKKFRPLLERVKPFAVRNPSDLAALMSWMNENALAEDVVKWIDKLSKNELTFPPVSIAVAATYANTKNWSRLRRWTGTGSWGNSDYLRIAYQAIATRKSRNGGTEHTEFEKLWRSAEQVTNEQPERELDLARLASKWNLEKESEQLWSRVAKNPPMRREALDALRRLYRTNDNLNELYDTLQRLHESSPNEAPITADLARLGINIKQNTKESHDLAKEAYDRARVFPLSPWPKRRGPWDYTKVATRPVARSERRRLRGVVTGRRRPNRRSKGVHCRGGGRKALPGRKKTARGSQKQTCPSFRNSIASSLPSSCAVKSDANSYIDPAVVAASLCDLRRRVRRQSTQRGLPRQQFCRYHAPRFHIGTAPGGQSATDGFD
jgi:Tfp pilus assembly protein PilF